MFLPSDWYWIADDGRVFASERSAIVDKTDATYAAWCEAGNPPTRWPADDAGAQTTASLQDVLTPYGLWATLPPLQAALCADIDSQAGALRTRYISDGPGQEATYLLKQSQALQALAAQGGPDAGKTAADLAALYPYLANEIGVTVDPSIKAPATDVYGVARAVQAVLQGWQPINLAIERVRLSVKAAIAAASTVSGAQAAHAAVVWPTGSTGTIGATTGMSGTTGA